MTSAAKQIAKAALRKIGLSPVAQGLPDHFGPRSFYTCSPSLLVALTRSIHCVVDCDLYSSASRALDFVYPLLGGQAIVLLDDRFDLARGERKAFEEFLSAHLDLPAREFCEIGNHGKGFELTRT